MSKERITWLENQPKTTEEVEEVETEVVATEEEKVEEVEKE